MSSDMSFLININSDRQSADCCSVHKKSLIVPFILYKVIILSNILINFSINSDFWYVLVSDRFIRAPLLA